MTAPDQIESLTANEIFVFGSNTSGKHGKGAALLAKQRFGARQGDAEGITGNCYAIPTRKQVEKAGSFKMETLPLTAIRRAVERFLFTAKVNPDLNFLVTQIGCGLAGYSPEQIAPMFVTKTDNVHLPKVFERVIASLDPENRA